MVIPPFQWCILVSLNISLSSSLLLNTSSHLSRIGALVSWGSFSSLTVTHCIMYVLIENHMKSISVTKTFSHFNVWKDIVIIHQPMVHATWINKWMLKYVNYVFVKYLLIFKTYNTRIKQDSGNIWPKTIKTWSF